MYYTTKDVRDIYKLSYAFQNKLRKESKLPHIRVPNSSKILYDKKEFEKWLNSGVVSKGNI